MNSAEIDITRDGWTILHDPGDRGLADDWPRHAPTAGWIKTTAGRAWQHTLGVDARGVAWYRRKIRIPESWRAPGMRVWLRFESVATDCRAWLNGVEVGRHVGDYLPFQFEITEAAAAFGAAEDAELIVRVDQMHAPRPAAGVLTENGHITKGFHDVLSLQHGGIWGGVSLRKTGPWSIAVNGVRVIPSETPGRGRVAIGLVTADMPAKLTVSVPHSSTKVEVLRPGQAEVVIDFTMNAAAATTWEPDKPALHHLSATLSPVDGSGSWDTAWLRFGLRTVTTGGPNNRNILLNGKPVLIRGVLHWGHEPEHIAPAPTPEQVRAEFARLKEMGFNCVCLCMWYAPEWYYDIADEMGMLIWQEHPVWKSPMEEENIPEYRRLFEGFFRRDRRHPSVVIVSGSCEHERFHPELAKWWWERAQQELPGTLKQVQTAFLAWTNPEQTDLHDEHVYESGGRWVAYMEDLQRALAKLPPPPKPFVMGETIIGNSWLGEAPGQSSRAAERQNSKSEKLRPWWFPKGYDECREFERAVGTRWGAATLERFTGHAERFNLAQRKFQAEVFRAYDGHAGFVMNQIRDVAQGRLGFMDDWGRWRFDPVETRMFLGDRALLLRTPDWRRGFAGGRAVAARIGVSNFGADEFEGYIDMIEASRALGGLREPRLGPVVCERGCVGWAEYPVDLPRTEGPARLAIAATAGADLVNGWDLWVFPDPGDVPDGVLRLDGIEFSRKDREPDFEERAYSSGWGLKCETWRPVLPDPSIVLFKCPVWRFDAPLPEGTRVIVTHKLTRSVVEFLEGGGRVILLASKAAGGLGTKYFTTWAQSPLVIEGEDGPLRAGDSGWIVDLLHHDLTRRYTRAIPVKELGIIDQVEPIVRLVFTHDSGVPRPMDAVFAARVGKGLLIATSLDHTEDAGRYLMQRLLEWTVMDGATCRGELDPALVRSWTIEASGGA